MNKQSQRLKYVLNKTLQSNSDTSYIEAITFVLNTLIKIKPIMFDDMGKAKAVYKNLSAEYVSHILNGKDSLCERYKCRDALNDYNKKTEAYMSLIFDIKWLQDEIYALKIVELCRGGE